MQLPRSTDDFFFLAFVINARGELQRSRRPAATLRRNSTNDHAAALLNTKRLDHLRAPYLEVRTLLLRIPTPGTLPLPSHYRSRSARYTLRDPVPHDYVSTFQFRLSLAVSRHLCTRKCTSKNRVTYAHEAVKNGRSIREHAANLSVRSRELFLSLSLFFRFSLPFLSFSEQRRERAESDSHREEFFSDDSRCTLLEKNSPHPSLNLTR